ncbi:EAL domain-containing protein [Kineococcus sp. NBC_00420]|uniref:EAL domain-containing protein n=1 Tax=Kineococcus sp. NBC_00420 TaxID=2903564 RepID=UPI002E1D04C1
MANGARRESPADAPVATVSGPPVVDFTSAATATLEHLHRHVGMDTWAIARRDGDDYVVLSALDGGEVGLADGSVLAWADTFCASSVAGDAPRFSNRVDEVAAWAHAREATGFPWISYLSVPLRAPDGRVLGSLCAGARETQPDPGLLLGEVELAASLLGTLLAYEVRLQAEARRAEHAEATADHDALTGLGNRRAWDAALALEEARARRLGTTASVLVLDLDALKETNDTQGHEAGDELLVRTARALRDLLRPEDLVVRLGGDEFAALLPDVDAGAVADLVARLRAGLRVDQVRASLGVATRRAAEGLHTAWHAADSAMYADKAARAGTAELATGSAALDLTSPGPGRVVGGAATGPHAPTVPERIEHLLDAVRRQLGMDAAVLVHLEGDAWRLQYTATGPGVRDPRGFACPREESYCQRLLDGHLDSVIPDARAHPATASLGLTEALDIGAYLAAPVHLRDGSLYGTLCAISSRPQPDLRQRDAGVLEVLAEAMSDLLTQEEARNGRRRRVLARLDQLHRDGGPRPVFQPVVDLRTLRPVGVEALSRFPEGEPAAWFGQAADVGAGVQLELAALTAALREAPEAGFLALNVSPEVASSPALARLLQGRRLDAIVLEITEHEQVEDYATLLRHLDPLRRDGVRIAVDDAGAGFASMRHVLALDPEFVKLDMSLVQGIDRDGTRQALTASLATFAQRTGATLIAEGIETQAELDCVLGLGVLHGQGFHLGRPRAAGGG